MASLLYEDPDAALELLTSAFGFSAKFWMTDNAGRINQAEVQIGDGVLMLGTPGGDPD